MEPALNPDHTLYHIMNKLQPSIGIRYLNDIDEKNRMMVQTIITVVNGKNSGEKSKKFQTNGQKIKLIYVYNILNYF